MLFFLISVIMNTMHLKTGKITMIVLTVLISCAFLVSSLVSFQTARNSLRSEIRNSSLPLLSENIYSELHKALAEPINVSSSMAEDSFLINWVTAGEEEPDKINLYLNKLKQRYGFFSTFFISEVSRNYYYYNGVLKQISPLDKHDVWYYDFKESGKDMDLDVDTNEADNGSLTVFINYRLKGFDGRFLGVVGVGIKLEKVAEFLNQKQTKYNRDIYLVDENGYIQVHSDLSLIEKSNIYTREGIALVAEELMGMTDSPIDSIYNESGQTVLVSSRYIPEMGWHVIVEQNESSSYFQARKSLYVNLLITALIAVVLFTASYMILKSFQSQMENIAGTDSLTSIANRRELSRQFEQLKYRTVRYGTKMSLILIDLDNFKMINDGYGHLAGDNILKELSSMIAKSLRPVDTVARWGGDEFVILIEASSDEAMGLGERLRYSYCETIGQMMNGRVGEILSMSMGVTEYRENEDFDTLIKRADEALYKSKLNGKDRISCI